MVHYFSLKSRIRDKVLFAHRLLARDLWLFARFFLHAID